MVDFTAVSGYIDKAKELWSTMRAAIAPVVTLINDLLTKFLPGSEELAVLGFSLLVGYSFAKSSGKTSGMFDIGGYAAVFKFAIIIFLVLRFVFGIGG